MDRFQRRKIWNALALIAINCCFLAAVLFEHSMAAPSSEKRTPLGKCLFINEICASNTVCQADDGNYYDWVELYNSSDKALDISGFGLSDHKPKPFLYTFPSDTIVPAKGYLVVFCDKNAAAADCSIAGFGLSADGESVYLTSASNEPVDNLSYTKTGSDISYGRLQDEINTLLFFDEMSPGAENTASNVRVEAPTMSHVSGFYAHDFDLVLDAEGDIFYTLDGSIPTTESTLYSGPIHISDATMQPNRLCNYTNISTSEDYTPPRESIDKATVLRAVAVNKTGKMSKAVTATFFVGDDLVRKYADEAVLSLITDEKNLFADDTGIYVTGDTYQNWLNSSEYDSTVKSVYQPSNYRNRGKEWERSAAIQLFKAAENVLTEEIGIRIHGGVTRAALQKSFTLYARKEYGSSRFEYDFYGNQNLSKFSEVITVYDSIIIRNGGDSKFSRFRDKLNQWLVSDRKLITQIMTPAIVFINGEYWGQYEITEKISDDFIASHYGIEKDHITVIKKISLEDGREESLREWRRLFSWIKEADFSDHDQYDILREKIDIESLIDYICFNVYVNTADWGTNNTAWWKSEITDRFNPYTDGKWRFIVFDTEYSSGYDKKSQASADYFDLMSSGDLSDEVIPIIFTQIIHAPSFKKQFCQTFLDLANQNFAPDRVLPMIDAYAEEYEPYALDFYKRFYPNSSFSSKKYNDYVHNFKQFYLERFNYIVPYMKSALGLTGELVNVTIQNDDAKGAAALNTLDLSMPDGAWNGKYYTDYDIHLKAAPKSGLRFRCFEISSADGTVNTVFENDVDIPIHGDTVVKIIYDE